MIISIDRKTLLEKLNAVLKSAQAEDVRIAAAHERDEQTALKAFREQLREALKWDYKTAKKEAASRYSGIFIESPPCPRTAVAPIQLAINEVTMDMRKSDHFNISPGTNIYLALMWLPESKRIKESVCD